MINLLIAEDDKVIRRIIEKNARENGFNVFTAGDGTEALRILHDTEIHIAILDWVLPGIEGIEICRKIRSERERDYTYLILLTSKTHQDDLIEGFSAGADDYIRKPFNSLELIARIKTGKRIIELQNELLEIQEELRVQATHDGLTKLLNRSSIIEKIESEFIRSERENSRTGLIIADIDHFKKINDTYGHQAGDYVLKKISAVFKRSLRKYDRVGRYGGEEFLILLPNCSRTVIEKVAERLRREISESEFMFEEKNVHVTVSLGLAVTRKGDERSPEMMLLFADQAMYEAKRTGRDRWVFAETDDLNNKEGGKNAERSGLIRERFN